MPALDPSAPATVVASNAIAVATAGVVDDVNGGASNGTAPVAFEMSQLQPSWNLAAEPAAPASADPE